jgi:SAM-dependent methyltransferase
VTPPTADRPSLAQLRSRVARLSRAAGQRLENGNDWTSAPAPTWTTPPALPGVWCNVCGWKGSTFEGPEHCEAARCPVCGSIGRDRFLLHSVGTRVAWRPGLRLLETSPRMGDSYREAMGRWFDYLSSDYDERAHRGAIRVDLQAIDLADDSLDVVVTAHVLEHVPDTDKALAELRRVLVPGGWLLLQVPLLQPVTAPPVEPEFHGDNTPVFWRFGFDLSDRLRGHGFAVELLCTDELHRLAEAGAVRWPGAVSAEFDADALLQAADPKQLTPVADAATANRLGFLPAYMYATWACRAPV